MNVSEPSESVITLLVRIQEAERRLGPWLEGLRDRTQDPDLREFIDLWNEANQAQITRTRAALAWLASDEPVAARKRNIDGRLAREFGLLPEVGAREVSGVLWECARAFAEAYERVLSLVVRDQPPAVAEMLEFSREHSTRVLDTIRALNEALAGAGEATA